MSESPMTEDEIRRELAAANDYADLRVRCSDESHAPKIVNVATFRLFRASGVVDLVVPQRDDGRGRVTMRTWHELGTAAPGVRRSHRAPLARAVLITGDGRIIDAEQATSEDRSDPESRWHWELRCDGAVTGRDRAGSVVRRRCGKILRARAERLSPLLAAIIKADTRSIELAHLVREAAKLGSS